MPPRPSQIESRRASLAIIYSYGDFTASTSYVRSDDPAAAPIQITRESCVPSNKVEAFFKNPIGNLGAAQTAPLRIEKAVIGPRTGCWPRLAGRLGSLCLHGLLRAGSRRLRVAGSVRADAHPHSLQWHEHCAGNQPTGLHHAGRHLSAFCQQTRLCRDVLHVRRFTVVYFLVAAFLLPETKGKTLEEIEAHFEGVAG